MNFPSPDILKLFKETRGAISIQEGVAIHWLARQAPEGDAIDLGTHCGKAAIMASAGFVTSRKFHLVDPGFDVNNAEAWEHSVQGSSDKAWHGFHEDLFPVKVLRTVSDASQNPLTISSHGDYSLHAIPAINGPFSFVFIDSDVHTYDIVKPECELLRNRMVIGGIIAFHDFGPPTYGVEQAMREMLPGGQYEEIGIPWREIKEWVHDNDTPEANISWHKAGEKEPCYLGALIRRK